MRERFPRAEVGGAGDVVVVLRGGCVGARLDDGVEAAADRLASVGRRVWIESNTSSVMTPFSRSDSSSFLMVRRERLVSIARWRASDTMTATVGRRLFSCVDRYLRYQTMSSGANPQQLLDE